MTKKNYSPSIKYNFVMNLILTITNVLFPLITFPYFSRILQPDGMGKIAFATSWVNYFILISQLGIPTYGIRKCAQVRDDRTKLSRTVHELLIINIMMTILSYTGLFISLLVFKKLTDIKILIIVISSSIVLTSIGINWLYSALEQYSYITKRSIVMKIISLILMFLTVTSKNDYVYYALATVIATSGSSILNIINARKYIDFKPLHDYNIRQHLKPILILFATSAFITIYTNLDAVMLGFMKSDSVVGFYSASIKINRILLTLITSLGVVILPRMSFYFKNNMQDQFITVTKKAINFVIFASLPLMLYFTFYAREAILFIAGDSFTEAILPMQISMPIILLIGLSNLTGIQMLVPMGKENKLMLSVVAGAFFNLVSNLILIPTYGASGAAFSTTLAEIIVLLVQIYFLKDYLNVILGSVHYWNISVITGVLTLVLFIMKKLLNFNQPFWELSITFSLFMLIFVMTLKFLKEPLYVEIVSPVKKMLKRLG